ncbi:MAG: nitrate/nitrite sensor protein NarX [Methanocella sp. PtaU1.Bin125]|nr:MAG: nitrate/nitrite sensor protein NarX [Methanocella sp. PtaU1.Bin125]
MDFGIIRVKGFNLLLIFLISIQITLLVMTAMLFLFSSVNSELPITTVISAALLLLFCVPMCIVLYKSNTDKIAKTIFLGLSITLTGFFISGIIWYVLPSSIDWGFLVPLGMLIMVACYAPLIVALLLVYIEQRNKLNIIIQQFIFLINIAFAIFLIYYVITNYPSYTDSSTDSSIDYVMVYTISTLCDTIILSFVTILILINIPTKLRYLFSIIFGMSLLSFIGDSLKLLGHLELYDTLEYSQYFYDFMLIFISFTLLIYALSNIKITSIEEVNKKLQDTSLVIDDLIMQSPDAMCMCDVDGQIIKANEQFLKTFGILDSEVIKTNNIFSFNYNYPDKSFDIVKNGEAVQLENFELIKGNTLKYYTIKLFPTFSSDGKISKYIFLGEDITLRKNAEDQLKNANDKLEARVKERTAELSILNQALQKEIQEHTEAEEKISTSLKEKEVLLKEIHHRVKNNMQIISSMLGLQSAYVKNEKLNEILKDSQNRIKSMALIHEKLYQSNNMANVNFKEYIETLISNLSTSYNIDRERIIIEKNIDNISLNIDTAIPLGLIINELLSNALKHAFPDNRKGVINININQQQDNYYLLNIKDNGIGFPAGLDLANTRTLGLNLVNALAEQINGKLNIKIENGTNFELLFPK